MKNKLADLNNHLFEQLERLNDSELKGDLLIEEIERSKAMVGIASEIIEGGRLVLDAQVAIADKMVPRKSVQLITGPKEKDED